MQRVSTATNKNSYLVSPKFYLNPPRVKRTGVDRTPWLAKMQKPMLSQMFKSQSKFRAVSILNVVSILAQSVQVSTSIYGCIKLRHASGLIYHINRNFLLLYINVYWNFIFFLNWYKLFLYVLGSLGTDTSKIM